LVDQSPELTLRHGECLLCVDLLDQRNSAAGRLDKVKRLRPARTDTRSPSVLTLTLVFSGSERKISSSLRPGTVISPGCARSCAGRHQFHLDRFRHAQSIVPGSQQHVRQHRHGLRRSTTPMTLCRGTSSSSRVAVSFMGI